MDNRFDIIVVGAGPAGCSTAWHLARAGKRVLLADRAVFPREKVCGDGVSAGSLAILDRMGVIADIERLRPFKVHKVFVSAPSGEVMRGRIPSVNGSRDYGYAIPRRDLDNILFEKAASMPGVTAVQGLRIKDLMWASGRPVGVRGQNNGREKEFRAPFIIGADGVHSIVAKKIGAYNRSSKYKMFAVRAYFENVDYLDSSMELHFDSDIIPGYGWLFPLGNGRANVGAGIGNQFVGKHGVREIFDIFIKQNKYVKDRLKNARMVAGSLRGWPLHNGAFPSRRHQGNALLVGDAASFIDPISGEGIYFALKSGELAAAAVLRAAKKGVPALAGPVFERLWRRSFYWKEFIPGLACQYLLSRESFVNLAIGRCARNPEKAKVFCGAMAHTMPKIRLLPNF